LGGVAFTFRADIFRFARAEAGYTRC